MYVFLYDLPSFRILLVLNTLGKLNHVSIVKNIFREIINYAINPSWQYWITSEAFYPHDWFTTGEAVARHYTLYWFSSCIRIDDASWKGKSLYQTTFKFLILWDLILCGHWNICTLLKNIILQIVLTGFQIIRN